ncbi:MAG: sulfite exporter TauE/SafE family protein [Kyrpidia sp.]|nr:sulfite exporter TauE/SafE family protein [Kyrpidia sp.]
MTVGLALTLTVIGAVGALLSGMLGVGGAIVNYPMLLYIPPILGVGVYSPHEVAGIVALQVLFSTVAGVIAQRGQGVIHRELVLIMGISVLVGSFVGGYGAKFLSGNVVNVIYAILATIAAVLMSLPKRGEEEIPLGEIRFNKWIAVASALTVGAAAGIVGAGGAFLLVPVMLQILKIPTRVTIASSLAITFLSSLGSSAGKLLAGHLPLAAAAVVIVAGIIAAPIGVRVGRMMNVKVLRAALGVVIIATTVKIWSGILF